MQSLCATAYGCQKLVKGVREFMYGCTNVHNKQHSDGSSVSTETIAKVEQEQEMLEDWCVTVCKLCKRIPQISKSMIGNVAGEFYDRGI